MQNRRTLIVVVSVVLAVIAGVIAYLYVSNADERASDKVQTTKIYVAAAAIPQGTTGEAAEPSIQLKEFLKESVPPDAISSTADLTGKVAVAPISVGMPITTALFRAPGTTGTIQSQLDAAKGQEAIALALPGVQGVNGLIQPGDRINLIISGSSTDNRAAYFMQNVKVLGVGTATSAAPAPGSTTANGSPSAAPTAPSGGALIVEVDPIGAERIMLAQVSQQQIYATLIPAAYQPPESPTDAVGLPQLLDPSVASPGDPNTFPVAPQPNPKKPTKPSKSTTSTTTSG